MDPILKLLIDILKEDVIIVTIKDNQLITDIQRQAMEHDIRIQSRRIPYDYETTRGYIWQHNNSRKYELSI